MSVVKFEACDKGILPIGKFFGRVSGYFLFSLALIFLSLGMETVEYLSMGKLAGKTPYTTRVWLLQGWVR